MKTALNSRFALSVKLKTLAVIFSQVKYLSKQIFLISRVYKYGPTPKQHEKLFHITLTPSAFKAYGQIINKYVSKTVAFYRLLIRL